nr:germacrene A synthase short form-like [Tanacetum cinerariifolium]
MRTVHGKSNYDNQADSISFQFFVGSLCIWLIWCVDNLERRPGLQVFRQKEELHILIKWYKDMEFQKISPFARKKLLELYLWTLAVFVEPRYFEKCLILLSIGNRNAESCLRIKNRVTWRIYMILTKNPL